MCYNSRITTNRKVTHVISLPFQTRFRPALPNTYGPKDYRDFREVLIEADRILVESGAEDAFVRRTVAKRYDDPFGGESQLYAKAARKALRHVILLSLCNLSFRELALRLPDSTLFQWFTGSAEIDRIRTVSKSTLERFEKMFDRQEIADLIHDLNRSVMDQYGASTLMLREEPLNIEQLFADTTCVAANIHFPVDWVLLRDGVRTLTKGVSLIRAQGLLHRMSSPRQFMKQMNQLCIEMTHTRRKKDGEKFRKLVFRRMKKLARIVSQHAERHRDLLLARREETDWTEAQAAQVRGRIENVLDQLPAAIHQAHERLIGQRQVQNSEKILSLYEPDVHVIVRGKAGAAVEFGNGLYLVEQAQGLIIDWNFIRNQPSTDSSHVIPSFRRIRSNYELPLCYAGDRGFDSKANRAHLEEVGVFNAICPKDVADLRARLEGDKRFGQMQTRRASTEGRVAILKNCYIGTPLRSKGFAHRATRIEWCIFAHNLWKISAMTAERRRELLKARAA